MCIHTQQYRGAYEHSVTLRSSTTCTECDEQYSLQQELRLRDGSWRSGQTSLDIVSLVLKKTLLEERLKNKQLDDRKGREDVVTLLSADGKPLSGEQVRIWVDNFRVSLKRKKTGEDKQSEPNDKE